MSREIGRSMFRRKRARDKAREESEGERDTEEEHVVFTVRM